MTSFHQHGHPVRRRVVDDQFTDSSDSQGHSGAQISRSLRLLRGDVSQHPEHYPTELAGLFADMILDGVIEAVLHDDGSVAYRGTPAYVAKAQLAQDVDGVPSCDNDEAGGVA